MSFKGRYIPQSLRRKSCFDEKETTKKRPLSLLRYPRSPDISVFGGKDMEIKDYQRMRWAHFQVSVLICGALGVRLYHMNAMIVMI